jgi:hypothetical protein
MFVVEYLHSPSLSSSVTCQLANDDHEAILAGLFTMDMILCQQPALMDIHIPSFVA